MKGEVVYRLGIDKYKSMHCLINFVNVKLHKNSTNKTFKNYFLKNIFAQTHFKANFKD